MDEVAGTIQTKDITVIEWIDSSVQNNQVDHHDFPKPVKIISVGFIVEETTDYIVLARDDMGDGEFRGLCAIPIISITKEVKTGTSTATASGKGARGAEQR